MRFLLFLFIPLLLLSCADTKKERYPRYSSFPQEKALKAEVIPLDTALFRYPFRITVRGGIALVLDLHNADHYMHAFSVPEWRHLVSFGRRGHGPDELLSAETFQFDAPDSVWVLDANRQQITRWSVDAKRKSASREEEIPLDKRLIRTLDFCRTADGFIVPDYSGEYRYHRLDRKGQVMESAGRIPTENRQAAFNPALAQAWRSFLDYHPADRQLVMATQLGEALDVMNLANQTGKTFYGPFGEPKYQTSGTEGIPTGIMGFSDIQLTNRLIYAVFHGRTFREIEKNLRAGKKNEDGGRTIYVFDRVGRPAIKYTLDRAIYGIHVDEATKTIYATDVNSDNPIVQLKIEKK